MNDIKPPYEIDALFDALSNLEHDNYERSYSGSKNREADAGLIRAALERYATLVATGTVLDAAPVTGGRTLPLNWNPVPETLPPNPDNFFSPRVWLALSDGRVSMGCCLHHEAGVISKRPVHAWFVDDEELDEDDGVTVVAWMPFAVPDHPQRVLAAAPTPLAQTEQQPVAPEDYKIPCDVMLPPATRIKRGCSLNTLKVAMAQRESLPTAQRVFAAAPVTAQKEDEVECGCGDIYPADSYGAGFIDALGHCPNCEAAEPFDDSQKEDDARDASLAKVGAE